jgi:dipeptidyl aminopeptidase/acylaminoacyl peptidase
MLIRHLLIFVMLMLAGATRAAEPSTQPVAEPAVVKRSVESGGKEIEYLVIPPSHETDSKDRWMLVFLHGAGGSLKGYNLARPPYAKIREALAENGAYVVVPALGSLHFMGDDAKAAMTKVIDRVCEENQINPKRVHLMGTSMGAGSVLAYAVNFPDRVKSVCAIMPMTDFISFTHETPKYIPALKEAYHGTAEENPQAYDANSALWHPEALKAIRVCLVHGVDDKTVRVSHSDLLAEKLRSQGSPCTYIRLEGAGHKDDIVTDIQDQIIAFLLDAKGK